MTRAELLQRMSASEFSYWVALYQVEQHERERAQQDAENKARAQRLARSMRA
jgi:hypothetical protein